MGNQFIRSRVFFLKIKKMEYNNSPGMSTTANWNEVTDNNSNQYNTFFEKAPLLNNSFVTGINDR